MQPLKLLPDSVPKERAIELCNKSIRRMLDNYRQYHNPRYPALIRKRFKLRNWLQHCNQSHFTREELGLITNGWLIGQIGAVSAMIVKTNRFT